VVGQVRDLTIVETHPTFNVRDFAVLARRYPRHDGITLAAQSSWTLGLIAALDQLLSETRASDWIGQMRWLNEWQVR
jgi:hypothetical protein